MLRTHRLISLTPVLACAFAFAPTVAAAPRHARRLIRDAINEGRLHRLAGNTHWQANASNDQGRVSGSFAMEHMLLQMQRPAEQEQALQQLIGQLHNPASPNYHHWLTAADFQAYGPAQEDIDTITGWLKSHGFTINTVYPSGMTIDFSGTAEQVREAFHTEIHYLNVNGRRHAANMSDPEIPEALAPAVAGVVSMHDFKPHALSRARPKFTYPSGDSTYQALVPEDLATVYNITPAFQAGYTGKGQTIAVLEDSDLYSDSDWDTFRSTFGLSQYDSGSLTTVHPAPPSGRNNCADPGVDSSGDDGEAALDAEWASAAAPDAAIQVVSCSSTRSTFGGLIALENLLSANTPPPSIVSISYGECEAENGASANAAFNSVYQQAVAEGVSIFVAAGDEGAASCDSGATAATHGIGVSAYASTPYNVAVGGTDFADSVQNSTGAYWNPSNDANYGSAVSYVPEIPWNDSCAGSLLANYFGFSAGYGSGGFCNSSTASQNSFLSVQAGSGGPSGCASGSPSTNGVVGGSCQGYVKPSWQAGVTGLPDDGVRDIPDISIFAGTGTWGHYYVTCWSNVRGGGARCDGDPSNWAGAGGTSFGAPIMAGIQALINQKTGSAQGNPNYVYYALASDPSSICDSSSGAGGSNCVFYNVTQGDIAVNCGGNTNCFGSTSGTGTSGGGSGHHHIYFTQSSDGALSLSSDSYSPAYGTATGWNFATGIGSVNVFNLLNHWSTGQ